MNKFVLLILICFAAFTSCSIDDNGSNFIGTEILPIESVEIPESFVYGESYEILITYNRPSTCHQFYNFFYEIDRNERTVAVINSVYSNESCVQESESVTVTLNFTVNGTETYLFKFYQGEDADGEDQYLLVEVPILDE